MGKSATNIQVILLLPRSASWTRRRLISQLRNLPALLIRVMHEKKQGNTK